MNARRAETEEGTSTSDRGPRRRSGRRSWARRKHLGWITFLTVVVVLVAGLAFVLATWDSGRTPPTQQAATAGGTAPAVSTGATSSPSPATSGTAPSVSPRGTITAVGDNQWTFQANSGLSYTVVITPTTTFKRNKTFAEYAVGDPVNVLGTLDAGVITATAVGPAGG